MIGHVPGVTRVSNSSISTSIVMHYIMFFPPPCCIIELQNMKPLDLLLRTPTYIHLFFTYQISIRNLIFKEFL